MLILTLAVIIGLGLRLSVVVLYDFPLNDGGLFFTMIEDLVRNGLRTPLYTTYNAANIPFVYPPLGLYAAAVLAETGAPPAQLLRFVPAAISALTVPAFYRLALTILNDRLTAAFAALAIAILPESFAWRIMGGGITRSPGFLFGILGLFALCRLLENRDWKVIAMTSAFWSATILSHPEAAVHTALGVVVLLAFRLRRKAQALAVVTAGGSALVLTAIWWLPALKAHGLAPWLEASGSSDWIPWYVLLFRMLDNLDAVTLALALLGVFVGARPTTTLLLAYGAAMFVALPRSATQFAALVVAMLFGIGMKAVFDAILKPLDTRQDAAAPATSWRRPSRIALAVLLLFTFVPNWANAVSAPTLRALSPHERKAMDWAAQNTETGSAFLIVEGTEFYAARNSEWFPALSGRVNAVAVQGSEWLRDVNIEEQIESFRKLQSCGYQGVACLDAWLHENDTSFSYVYVLKKNPADRTTLLCCRPLIATMGQTDTYAKVFENLDVVIYRRLP